MNQFFIFIKKETMHILRDVYTLVILLIMPIALLLILGYATSFDMKNVPFSVLDESKSPLSMQLVQKINANPYFSLETQAYNKTDIEQAFQTGKIKMAIIIPAGFDENLQRLKTGNLQVIIDASNPNEATTIENYIQLIINEFQSGQSNSLFRVNGEVVMLYNPQMKSSYSFVPGLMGMLMMLICAMMTSSSIVREKERGTMEILLISPLKPTSIVLAKAIPYFAVSMIDVGLILLIAVFLMGVPINGSLLTVLVLAVVFTLSSLSLGLLISSITSDQATAMLMAVVGLMVPTMLLAGVLFPVEGMPKLLQWLSNVVPAKWFISAIRDVMIKGVGLTAIWKEVTVLFGMTLFLLIFSIKKFKNRL